MKKILFLLTITTVFLFIFLLFPVQYAVNEPAEKNYILCKMQRSTDSDWYVVNEKNGDWIEDIVIINDEQIKSKYGYDFHCADNIYYIYGDFISNTNNGYRVFKCVTWDIKYPIKRNQLFFLSPNYTCQIDRFF